MPGLVLVGAGTGLVTPGIAGAALAAVPAERAGMAGGAVNTFRQLGYALGIALCGTVLTSRMQDTLPHDAAHALAGGGAGALGGMFSEHDPAGGLRLRAGPGGGGRRSGGRGRGPAGARPGQDGADDTGPGNGTGRRDADEGGGRTARMRLPDRPQGRDPATAVAVIRSYRFGGDYGTETYSTVSFLSDPSPCERIFRH